LPVLGDVYLAQLLDGPGDDGLFLTADEAGAFLVVLADVSDDGPVLPRSPPPAAAAGG